MITNAASGTNLHEIAPGIYRINTPVALPDHTGARGLFPLVSEAIAKVLPLASIRYVAFSHFEADECGALNQFLAAAPRAVPVASQVGAMVSVNAFADRPAKAMADGDVLRTQLAALRRLMKITPVNTVVMRRRLADAAVAKGGYVF